MTTTPDTPLVRILKDHPQKLIMAYQDLEYWGLKVGKQFLSALNAPPITLSRRNIKGFFSIPRDKQALFLYI